MLCVKLNVIYLLIFFLRFGGGFFVIRNIIFGVILGFFMEYEFEDVS